MTLVPPVAGFEEFLLHRESYAHTCQLILLKDCSVQDLMEVVFRWTPEQRDAMTPKLASTYEFNYPDELIVWLLKIGMQRFSAEKLSDALSAFRLVQCTVATFKFSFPDYQDHPFEPRAYDLSDDVIAHVPPVDMFDPLARRRRSIPRF